jgi:pyruvate,water dikinase
VSGLRGIAAAPGIATGHVRIVRDAHDVDGSEDEVLVARFLAAPALALLRAAAIVTEMGGSSAHAVSLARERGLPMVTGVIGASRTLRDGDLVRVDGTRGLVERAFDQNGGG